MAAFRPEERKSEKSKVQVGQVPTQVCITGFLGLPGYVIIFRIVLVEKMIALRRSPALRCLSCSIQRTAKKFTTDSVHYGHNPSRLFEGSQVLKQVGDRKMGLSCPNVDLKKSAEWSEADVAEIKKQLHEHSGVLTFPNQSEDLSPQVRASLKVFSLSPIANELTVLLSPPTPHCLHLRRITSMLAGFLGRLRSTLPSRGSQVCRRSWRFRGCQLQRLCSERITTATTHSKNTQLRTPFSALRTKSGTNNTQVRRREAREGFKEQRLDAVLIMS